MDVRKFGYIRVSSKDQNEGRQLEAMKKMGVDHLHPFTRSFRTEQRRDSS